MMPSLGLPIYIRPYVNFTFNLVTPKVVKISSFDLKTSCAQISQRTNEQIDARKTNRQPENITASPACLSGLAKHKCHIKHKIKSNYYLKLQ